MSILGGSDGGLTAVTVIVSCTERYVLLADRGREEFVSVGLIRFFLFRLEYYKNTMPPSASAL